MVAFVSTTIARRIAGAIPVILIEPATTVGAAVLLHGYGGCKEELLGLALRVSDLGLATILPDLRGHGESSRPLDVHVMDDVEATVADARRWGPVTTIGHSLGGRLALCSSAPMGIGISPALPSSYGPRTRARIGASRDARVRASGPDVLFSVLAETPEWEPAPGKLASLLYGSRDLPEIVLACQTWADRGASVAQIDHAQHADICLMERTFALVTATLEQWLGLADLR
jgi:pimeloyl-ACP methyl ester carboxylesterase